MKLVIATANPGKIREARGALERPGIQVLTRDDFDRWPEVEETGGTLEENALIKAEALRREFGMPALADDSGLAVDHLGGRPGVRSSRYAGPEGDAEKNMELLLEELEGVPPDRRTARFLCVLALALPGEEIVFTRGECRGFILTERRGSRGFGYDPVFRPEGYEATMAELTVEEKNAISHRGMALEEMAKVLEGLTESRGGG